MAFSFMDSNGNRIILGANVDAFQKLSASQRNKVADYLVNRWDVIEDIDVRAGRARAGRAPTPVNYRGAKIRLAGLIHKSGRTFMEAAKSGDARFLSYLLRQGFPVNAREPATSFTALHHTAGNSSEDAVNVLLECDDIDLLKRDGFGRLASELAGRFGENLELSRRLRSLELAQAQKQGITLTYRPRPPATED